MVLTQFGLRHVPPMAGAAISVPTTAILFWLSAPFELDLVGWSAVPVAIFAIVGVFFPAAVTMLIFEANQRMGPTVASTISGTAPLFAIAGAVLFLAERLTARGLAGTLAIVLGVAALSWRDKAMPRRWSIPALALPLGAAAVRGLAQTLTRAGLVLWPNPFVAGLIGYTVSSATVITGARLRHGRSLVRHPKGFLWFALVGVFNGGATFSLYVALSRGTVAVVSPIVATYPLFTALFSAALLREEAFGLRVAAGVALTVGGVILLLLR